MFDALKQALSGAITDLKPAPIPDNPIEYEYVTSSGAATMERSCIYKKCERQ